MKYMSRLDWQVQDMNILQADFQELIAKYEFVGNQIGMTCRPGAEHPLQDNIGSISRRSITEGTYLEESVFSEFVPELKDTYFHHIYKTLPFKVGRMRITKLPPGTCYGTHIDYGARYHIVLITNPHVWFFFDSGKERAMRQIPLDHSLYVIDATIPHTVFNGHLSDDRYHILFSWAGEKRPPIQPILEEYQSLRMGDEITDQDIQPVFAKGKDLL